MEFLKKYKQLKYMKTEKNKFISNEKINFKQLLEILKDISNDDILLSDIKTDLTLYDLKSLIVSAMFHTGSRYNNDQNTLEKWQKMDILNYHYNEWITKCLNSKSENVSNLLKEY